MKIKVLHRSREEFDSSQMKPGSIQRLQRNPDPELHPFEKAREIQRALVATKLEKMFSKPLIGVLDGHRDSIKCMTRSHSRLTDLFTGSCDGEIRHWNLSTRECQKAIRAHDGFVRGLCTSFDDRHVFSCGDDGLIKQWAIQENESIDNLDDIYISSVESKGNLVRLGEDDVERLGVNILPLTSWSSSGPLTSVDSHQTSPFLISTGDSVNIWDLSRSSPINTFDYKAEVVYTARFNPSETNLFAASGGDNSVVLYDLRSSSSISSVLLKLRTNALCWNPMQPINFTVANEDHNLYTFDMRKLDASTTVHKDFTNSVLDVDYSPTGHEFVASSYDRTIRIFKTNEGRSRDVYHAKRMQIVLCCRYSADSRFVLSGSADFCVRLWKNKAWEKLGPKSPREKKSLAYREALKNRYQYLPEIRRILKHHHVPSLVKNAAKKKKVMEGAAKRKDINRRLHSKPGTVVDVPEKKKHIKE